MKFINKNHKNKWFGPLNWKEAHVFCCLFGREVFESD